jgi:hypothetical protein
LAITVAYQWIAISTTTALSKIDLHDANLVQATLVAEGYFVNAAYINGHWLALQFYGPSVIFDSAWNVVQNLNNSFGISTPYEFSTLLRFGNVSCWPNNGQTSEMYCLDFTTPESVGIQRFEVRGVFEDELYIHGKTVYVGGSNGLRTLEWTSQKNLVASEISSYRYPLLGEAPKAPSPTGTSKSPGSSATAYTGTWAMFFEGSALAYVIIVGFVIMFWIMLGCSGVVIYHVLLRRLRDKQQDKQYAGTFDPQNLYSSHMNMLQASTGISAYGGQPMAYGSTMMGQTYGAPTMSGVIGTGAVNGFTAPPLFETITSQQPPRISPQQTATSGIMSMASTLST